MRPTFRARLSVYEFDLDRRVVVGDALYSGPGHPVNFTRYGDQVLATFPVYLNRPLEEGGGQPSPRCPANQSASTLPDICRLLRRKSYIVFLNGRSAGNIGRYMYRIRPLYRGVVYRGYSLPQASADDDPVPDGFGVYARTGKYFQPEDYGFYPFGGIGGPFVDIRRDPWRIRPDLEFTMTYSSVPRCDPARGFIDQLADDSQPGGAPLCVSQPDCCISP
jgi:hypothetical protein